MIFLIRIAGPTRCVASPGCSHSVTTWCTAAPSGCMDRIFTMCCFTIRMGRGHTRRKPFAVHSNFLLVPCLALALAYSSCGAAEPQPHPFESKPLDYAVVVTGGELLQGAYPDAHTHFLTRT